MEKSAEAEQLWEETSISAGQGQGTKGTTVEGGPAHPDNTLLISENSSSFQFMQEPTEKKPL